MAYTTINKSTDHFNTLLYTGNKTANTTISGVGFQSDFTWIKSRTTGENHHAFDALRGGGNRLYPNLSNQQSNISTTLTSWTSDGFVTGTDDGTNANGQNFVAWNWKANGQGSSNTDGSINTTYTSANTTSGFSIIQYTGNSTSGATIGHGLGAVPKVFMCKKTNSAGDNWSMYHAVTGNTISMTLNSSTSTITNAKYWNNTTPTSSLITLGNGTEVNGNTDTFIGYAFAEKTGFSKFHWYTGNENANGTFVYTGFKPAFVMIKNYGAVSTDWFIHDNRRLGYNDKNYGLFANLTNTEATDINLDLLSNGFKLRRSTNQLNHAGNYYIYMAFAEAPLVGSNNVPCTAR